MDKASHGAPPQPGQYTLHSKRAESLWHVYIYLSRLQPLDTVLSKAKIADVDHRYTSLGRDFNTATMSAAEDKVGHPTGDAIKSMSRPTEAVDRGATRRIGSC